MMRSRAIQGAVTAAALLISGCAGKDDTAANTTGAANATDLTPEGPGLTARLFGGGRPMRIDAQATHPNGLVFQVTSIQSKPTETVLGVTIVNGRQSATQINWNPSGKKTFLTGASGEQLYLSPPIGNPNVSIPAGQRMEGDLVFLGRLPKAGNAVLTINEGMSSDSQYTSDPFLQLQLPLDSAAFSDDGSKKN